MISNHYGFLYQGQHNWVVLVAIMLGGALIRTSFVLRHKALAFGKAVPWQYAVIGTLVLGGVVFAMLPAPQATAVAAKSVTFADVQPVIAQRCQMCHNEQMQSKNVRLDSADEIAKHTQQIFQQAVALKTMPLNNATQITDAERALIGRWYEGGAPTR